MQIKTSVISLFIISTFAFSSCSSGWDSESKDMFYQTCMDDAKERGLDDAKSKSVCDCRLEAVQKNYPTLSEFMANLEKVNADEELKRCE